MSEAREDTTPWLVFSRGATVFALAASDVRMVLPAPRLSGFPTGFDRMLGVFAHRGRIYPLLDVIEIDPALSSPVAPIAIVTSSELGDVAWAADSVRGFELEPNPSVQRVSPTPIARRAREALRRSARVP